MMSLHVEEVQSALALLNDQPPCAQLSTLKELCEEGGGVWAIPDDLDEHQPVLLEMSYAGVFAASDSREQLPDNWRRAAQRMLRDAASSRAD